MIRPPILTYQTRLGTVTGWIALVAASLFVAVLFRPPEEVTGWPEIVAGGLLIATFLVGKPSGRRGAIAPLDVLLSAGTGLCLWYRLENIPRLNTLGSISTPTDLLVGAAFGFVLLEVGRRVAGWPGLAVTFGWLAALAGRSMLPESLRGPEFDVLNFLLDVLVLGDWQLTVLVQPVISAVMPLILFAGIVNGSGATALLVKFGRRLPIRPETSAAALLLPFVDSDDQARPAGARALRAAIAPLVPPILGAGTLVAALVLNVSYQDLAARLFWPGFLALLVVLVSSLGRAPSRSPDEPARFRLRDVGPLVGPPVLVIALVIGVPLTLAAMVAGLLIVAGSIVQSPSPQALARLVAGLLDSVRRAVLAGGLALFVGFLLLLEGETSLIASLSQRWFGLVPAAEIVLWPLLAMASGALFALAAGVVVGLSGASVSFADPIGAIVAGLLWAGVGAALIGQAPPHFDVRSVSDRILRVAPFALIALIATRLALGEGAGGRVGALAILDGLGILLVAWALSRPPGWRIEIRVLAFADGLLFLIPRPEIAIIAILLGVATLALAWPMIVRQLRPLSPAWDSKTTTSEGTSTGADPELDERKSAPSDDDLPVPLNDVPASDNGGEESKSEWRLDSPKDP